MKTISLLALLLSTNLFAANRPSLNEQLASFIKMNKEQVLKIAKEQYEYTYYSFPIEAKNCVAKKVTNRSRRNVSCDRSCK